MNLPKDKEEWMEFLKSFQGMVLVALVVLFVMGTIMVLVGRMHRGGDGRGTTFTRKVATGDITKENTANNSFAAAWRTDVESRVAKNEKSQAAMATSIKNLQQTYKKQSAQSQTEIQELLTLIKKGNANALAVASKASAQNSKGKKKETADQQLNDLLKKEKTQQGQAHNKQAASVAVGKWETIKVGGTEADINKEKLPKNKGPRHVRVPLGSFVRATLLTGAYAPTQGLPWPLLMRIDSPFQGPNGQTYPASGCFAIGDAKGHVGTEVKKILPNGQTATVGRVEIRITGISCDWGTVGFDQKVIGYAEGMDKQFGIEGIVHNLAAAKLKDMVMAGAINGLGQSLYNAAQQTQTVTNSGTALTYRQQIGGLFGPTLGSAVQAGSQQWVDYLKKQADKAVTTIEIPGDIRLDFYVVQSFTELVPNYGNGGSNGIYGKNGLY